MEQEILIERLNESEMKALDSLGRYKFEMFGYWASTWVKYNQLAYDMRIINKKNPNPFKDLVKKAKAISSRGGVQCTN